MADFREHYDAYAGSGLLEPATALHDQTQYDLNYRHLLPSNLESAVLDVGCGPGAFLAWLRGQGFVNSVGVDITPSAIEACRVAGLGNAHLIDRLGDFLHERPSSFHVVVMNDVIEHFTRGELPDILRLCKEALLPTVFCLSKRSTWLASEAVTSATRTLLMS